MNRWHARPAGHGARAVVRKLDTAYLTTRAAVPLMPGRRWGRVVTVASVTGPVMAMRGEVAYAAAKAGMVGSQSGHEARQGLLTPVGRGASPEEVATAITSPCSPGASWVTGQCLVVDGGGSIAAERG